MTERLLYIKDGQRNRFSIYLKDGPNFVLLNNVEDQIPSGLASDSKFFKAFRSHIFFNEKNKRTTKIFEV
jgi:hypothetical protein